MSTAVSSRLFPAAWTLTCWADLAIALMVCSFVLDGFLARRYAGGDGDADRGSWAALFITVVVNLGLTPLYTASGWGRIHWSPTLVAAFGFGLGLFGLALRYAAVFALGRLFTWRVNILPDHQLVTTGVFRFIRHPSYLGGALAVYGAGLAFCNWLTVAALSLTFLPVLLYRIRLEERALAAHFGPDFARYRAHSARLIPFLY